MATSWIRSLQCRSKTLEDVCIPNSKRINILPRSGCRKDINNLDDVIEKTGTQNKHKRKKKKRAFYVSPLSPASVPPAPPSSTRTLEQFFPQLTELSEGHPSRNIVEIIFNTRWTPTHFSGKIEMVFKVENLAANLMRFEEYREIVKSRVISGNYGSTEDNVRCGVDGNEMMRFHCLGGVSVYENGGSCGWFSVKGAGIETFASSGYAHESGGLGKGMRATVVCRVIAGRICKKLERFLDGGFESAGDEQGKLLVFDSRAVLPCFLVIYRTH